MSATRGVLGTAVGRTRRRVDGVGKIGGVRVKGSPVALDRRAAVVLASEGRAFSADSIRRAAELAAAHDGRVLVVSIARVHGTSFGLPNPGLMPTRAEWKEQHEHVNKAVAKLGRQGVRADGQVLGTRKPAQRIIALAGEVGAGEIVMAADADRPWLLSSMLWSQEPQHVARLSKLPVHLCREPAAS